MGEISYNTGKNQDKFFMPYIHACNIATGAHAGDLETIVKTMCFAKLQGVKIGIHPSYVDRENFGRKVIDEPIEKTIESIKRQTDIFKTVTEKLEYEIDHCKAHGALYHELNKNDKLAEEYLGLLKLEIPEATIYGMSGSPFIEKAKASGFDTKQEVFVDRRYKTIDKLVSREHAHAIIDDEFDFLDQLKLLTEQSKVNTETTGMESVQVDTICIHSDTPNALMYAKMAHQYLNSIN
jgi:UPF0271 protein